LSTWRAWTELFTLSSSGLISTGKTAPSSFLHKRLDITYAQYPFDQWMNFMLSHNVLIKKPGDVVEITLRGRDFITFMAHWGWNADMRKF
jgi:hypothetical protein